MEPRTVPLHLSLSSPLSSPPITLTNTNDNEMHCTSSKGHDRNDGSYFSRIKRSSTSKSTEPGLAARTLSPTVASRSSGESSRSPGSEHDLLRRLSSVYLTPPEEQDYDIPPFKPSRKDSTSLTMVQRTNTMPNHGRSSNRNHGHQSRASSKRKRSRNNLKGQRAYRWTMEKEDRSAMLQNLLTSNINDKELLAGSENSVGASSAHQGCLSKLMSNPANTIMTRRWSSVEVGADCTLPRDEEHQRAKNDFNKRISDHVIDHSGCLDAVQKILTSKKISVPRLNTPATITLRRASRPPPGKSRSSSIQSFLLTQSAITQIENHLDNDIPIAAYVITEHEVDKVTTLIEENMNSLKTQERKSQGKSDSRRHVSFQIDRKLSVTPLGLIPNQLSTAKTATTFTNIPGAFPESHSRRSSQSTITQKSHRKSRQVSVVVSRDSIHEIIWEDDGYPRRLSSASTTSSNSSRNSREQIFNHNLTVWDTTSDRILAPVSPTTRKASDTLSETTGLQSKSSTDSQSPRSDHKQKFKTYNPFATIELPKFVESFPALPPRKGTSDWISPLPSMDSRESTPEPCSLYTQGIDATRAPASLIEDNARRLTMVREASNSSTSASHQQLKDSPQDRRKSVIIPHPEATHRLSESSKSGSAIGQSSHMRRPSTPKSPRVKIEVPEPSRKKTWKKPRKDSGYPGSVASSGVSNNEQIKRTPTEGKRQKSLCGNSKPEYMYIPRTDSTHPEIIPPPVEDEEDEAEEVNRRYAAPRRSIWSMQVHSPPEQGRDHVGIYASLTGAKGEHAEEYGDHDCSGEEMSEPSVDWIG